MRSVCTRNSIALLTVALVLLTLGPITAAAETYAREFELRTLDHRLAESLVVDLCESMGKKPDRCKVQNPGPHRISVFASPEVHAEVVRLLAVRDLPPPTSLGFRILLVRPGASGDPAEPASPEIQRALDAVEELLGLRALAIQDTGLISTGDSGSTRLAAGDDRLYDVRLRLRSLVTRESGLELTVELEVFDTDTDSTTDTAPLLSSVVTLRAGETVVAGTSRARPDDEPLLILLSALPIDSGG